MARWQGLLAAGVAASFASPVLGAIAFDSAVTARSTTSTVRTWLSRTTGPDESESDGFSVVRTGPTFASGLDEVFIGALAMYANASAATHHESGFSSLSAAGFEYQSYGLWDIDAAGGGGGLTTDRSGEAKYQDTTRLAYTSDQPTVVTLSLEYAINFDYANFGGNNFTTRLDIPTGRLVDVNERPLPGSVFGLAFGDTWVFSLPAGYQWLQLNFNIGAITSSVGAIAGSTGSYQFSVSVAEVPGPGSVSILISGAGIFGRRRRRRDRGLARA